MRYDETDNNVKSDISLSIVQAIHMQKLLQKYSENVLTEEAVFYKEHFPAEWETAVNMSQHEIDDMISKWRLKLKDEEKNNQIRKQVKYG